MKTYRKGSDELAPKQSPVCLQDANDVVEAALSSAWLDSELPPPTEGGWVRLCNALNKRLAHRILHFAP